MKTNLLGFKFSQRKYNILNREIYDLKTRINFKVKYMHRIIECDLTMYEDDMYKLIMDGREYHGTFTRRYGRLLIDSLLDRVKLYLVGLDCYNNIVEVKGSLNESLKKLVEYISQNYAARSIEWINSEHVKIEFPDNDFALWAKFEMNRTFTECKTKVEII